MQAVIDNLKIELGREKSINQFLQATVENQQRELAERAVENSQLKESLYKTKAQFFNAEIQEESPSNKLIAKIKEKEKEKERLTQQLDAEEEFIVNILQKRISAIKGEKEDKEKEVDTLKSQLRHLDKERECIARQVEQEEDFQTNSYFKKIKELNEENAELKLRLSNNTNTLLTTHGSLHVEDLRMMMNVSRSNSIASTSTAVSLDNSVNTNTSQMNASVLSELIN